MNEIEKNEYLKNIQEIDFSDPGAVKMYIISLCKQNIEFIESVHIIHNSLKIIEKEIIDIKQELEKIKSN